MLKNNLSELSPTLPLSVWPIKKTWQHSDCFSSLMLPVTNMCHFSGLTLGFQPLNENTLPVEPPTQSSRLWCTTTIIINVRVAGIHFALVFMALGRRSFKLSFWMIYLHLNDLVFRVSFRNPQLKPPFVSVLPVMPGSLTNFWGSSFQFL